MKRVAYLKLLCIIVTKGISQASAACQGLTVGEGSIQAIICRQGRYGC